ncbi:uncharacterized protein [Rutidosis leptorrhynchoides]|uniref:uncharacterized protein n=1 Tax=Rutidosis leptorrhynchoides TaxID=125765 RepID=UPI003A990CFD
MENVMASMENGGLNVGSIKAFNIALLQKWRWRLHVSPNALWCSIITTLFGVDGGIFGSTYNGSSVCANIISSIVETRKKEIIPLHTLKRRVGNGNAIKFCIDHWIGDGPLMLRFNRLAHLDDNFICVLGDRLVLET